MENTIANQSDVEDEEGEVHKAHGEPKGTLRGHLPLLRYASLISAGWRGSHSATQRGVEVRTRKETSRLSVLKQARLHRG